MGWQTFVGSLKSIGFFAKDPYKNKGSFAKATYIFSEPNNRCCRKRGAAAWNRAARQCDSRNGTTQVRTSVRTHVTYINAPYTLTHTHPFLIQLLLDLHINLIEICNSKFLNFSIGTCRPLCLYRRIILAARGGRAAAPSFLVTALPP